MLSCFHIETRKLVALISIYFRAANLVGGKVENYKGSISLEFKGMPSILLESYRPRTKTSWLQRLSSATRRRRFSLAKPWTLELSDIGYETALNGIVEIPIKDSDGEVIVFDGATIPAPWLVSLLTIGILRPLGVVLVGSIVHDYAYQYGHLRVLRQNQESETVALERHVADKLFRDIIGTINQLPLVGYVAWLAVRLGWLFVSYNGKKRTGKPPIAEYLVVVALIALLYWLGTFMGAKLLCGVVLGIYLVAYVLSLFSQRKYSDDRLYNA